MSQDVHGCSPDWVEGVENEEALRRTEPEDGFVFGHDHERLKFLFIIK